MSYFKDFDCVSAGYLATIKSFSPSTREEYLAHLQKIYNYKLHTDFPLVLHIEPTSFCNQECRMCCHPTQKRLASITTDVIVEKAIAEAKKYRPWSTHFFFFGEPFLNKKLFKYISLAKNAGLRNISTTTNLTALTSEGIKKIPHSGLDSIHISYEGISREHYKAVRGKDTFLKATRNIQTLIEERDKQSSKLWISITFVRTTETDEEIEDFSHKWRPLLNDLHISPQFEYRNESIDGSRRQAIAKIQDLRNNGNIMFTSEDARVPCRQLWTRMVVTAQGELVPCSQNIDGGLSLGNILHTSIHEAWTSEAMQSLRMQHLSNCYTTPTGKICSGCTDWDWSGKVDIRPTVNSDKI
ncbi:MAG: radical SAM protein [Comamonadaceae bacterium]|nr:MAG: radical SAM protein [Comamonadaceae bacterium]